MAAAARPPPAPRPHARARNRRLTYLRAVLDAPGSDYFAPGAMFLRAPALYRAVLGEGAPVPAAHGDSANRRDFPRNGIVASLLDAVDYEAAVGREQGHGPRRGLGGAVDGQESVSEHETDEEGQDDVGGPEPEAKRRRTLPLPPSVGGGASSSALPDPDPDQPDAAEQDEDALLEELRRLMAERWLDGLDTEFDYSIVDQDARYDDVKQETQDAEDAWFDATSDDKDDGDGERGGAVCTDTGVLDY